MEEDLHIERNFVISSLGHSEEEVVFIIKINVLALIVVGDLLDRLSDHELLREGLGLFLELGKTGWRPDALDVALDSFVGLG